MRGPSASRIGAGCLRSARARGRRGSVAGTSGCTPSSELRGKEPGTRSQKCAASSPERASVISERGDGRRGCWGRAGSGGEASGGEECPEQCVWGRRQTVSLKVSSPNCHGSCGEAACPHLAAPAPLSGTLWGVWVDVPAAPQLPTLQQWGLVGGRQHADAGFPSCVMPAGLFEALSVGQRGCRWGR